MTNEQIAEATDEFIILMDRLLRKDNFDRGNMFDIFLAGCQFGMNLKDKENG